MTTFNVLGWELHEVGKPPRKRRWQLNTSDLQPDEVIVSIAGCGVCHTDLGFHYDGVRTKHSLPLVLGHEISGTVVGCGKEAVKWNGAQVIIPAVLPCGECIDCNSGHSNVCQHQIMPGNDVDGGFASHIRVPSRWLVKIPDNYQGDIAKLSVVADAISTPWQALLRADVVEGDTCIIVGCGGIGGYCAQLASSLKANVICIDVDQRRLESMHALGFTHSLNCTEKSSKEVKNYLREVITSNGWGHSGWKIFECSGHVDGQTLAFELIGPSGVSAIVGFTMSKVNIRLSNLMAHDARVFGNWGCQPELYPELLEMVVLGAVDLDNSTQSLPLSEICEVFENAHDGKYDQRVILIPENDTN